MTPEHLHILQHALGADEHGRQPQGYRPTGEDEIPCYRNRFITDPGGSDGLQCQTLVAQGLMVDHGPQRLAGGMHCYSVTLAGYDAMRQHSPPPPKLTRAQLRYQYYLEIGDLFPDGFRDFLKFIANPENRDRLPAGI